MKYEVLHEEIINLVLDGEFSKSIDEINNIYSEKGSWLNKIFKTRNQSNVKGKLSYTSLNKFLDPNKEIDLSLELKKINWEEDFAFELAELSKTLYILEESKKHKELELRVANFLKSFIVESSIYIENNSNDYPNNTITGKVWMDGAVIREWAQKLANYYGRKEMQVDEIDMCFSRCKITNCIMNHYPQEVGPDMISVGLKLEKDNRSKQAIKFFKPVLSDFKYFLNEIEEYCNDDDFEITEREITILNSLITAVKGLQRLDNYEDNENYIRRSEQILKKNAA
jgi:hypothetical protein